MDPNQLIPAKEHHQMKQVLGLLQRLNYSFHSLPSNKKYYFYNQFLLKRANLFWNSGNYENCCSDLSEANSNGRPFVLSEFERIMVLFQWKNRAVQVLESSPLLAKFLFDWCIPHAISLEMQAECLLFKGIATWLSGDKEDGVKLIEEVSQSYPDMIKEEAEKWKERAEGLLIKGSYVLSIDYCTLALQMTPHEAKYANLRCTLLSCRSVAYAKTNRLEEALEDAEECLFLTLTTGTASKDMYAKLIAVRGNIVMESHPSLAELFFRCSFLHAETAFDEARCLLFKAVAFWLSGNQEKAVTVTEEASKIYPDIVQVTVLSWKKCGLKALENKDFSKAKNLFQRSLIVIQKDTSQHKETRSHLLSNLATACFHLDEYQTALEKGKEAYALNPRFSLEEAEKWKERAEGLLIKGSYVLSIDYCTLAMQMTPHEAKYANLRCTLLSCRSVAYAKTNRLEEALEDAEECLFLTLTTDTASKDMYAKLIAVRGNIVMESHPSLAELFFRCSVLHAETAFDEARCLLFKAVAFWLSGKQERAVTVIEEASKIYPDIVQETVLSWKKSGIKALEDKDFSKAKNLFQRSLIAIQKDTSQHKETKSHLLSNLATACFHLDEYQTALEKGEEAYALNPIPSHEEAEKWKERIETIQRQENLDLLLQYCTLAIKFAPKGEHSEDLRFALLSSRCDIYFNMNQYEQALEDLVKCLARKPNWLKGLQQLGHIQLNHLGRHREAIQSYCKAFAIAGVHDKNSILQQILLISENIPDGTVDVTLDVPREIINGIIKQCVCDQDWRKLHLLFIGGGGPQKYGYGKGGLASGCDASGVPLELVVVWGLDNKAQHLSEFLNELLKNGALISGSQGCNESPLGVAEERHDKEVLRLLEKYKKSQGTKWRQKGTEAYDSGDLEKAVIAFKRSLQCEMDYQDRIEVHLALSKAYFEIEEYQKSISTCNKAEEFSNAKEEFPSPIIKSLLFELVCQRGAAHYRLRNVQQALQDGIKATQLNSDDIKGYTLLVSCYKDLQKHSEMLSTLNECLKRERNSEEQWKLLKEAIDVALKLSAETTALTAKIPSKMLERLLEKAVTSKDWNLVRLLYFGGGGPEKHPKGKGGIATGRVSAKKIAIEDVMSAKFKTKQETISVLLNEGASVNGLNSNPLVAAVEKGQVEFAKTLLKHNADPCVLTHDQPLVHQVIKKAMDTGNLTMLKCFLDSSHPFPNVKDSNGDGLYHLAMTGKSHPNKCNVIRCLLNANVDTTTTNKKGNRLTDCCKMTDDRRKMIEKFLNERNRSLPAKHVLPQASAKQSTKQDTASSSPSETKAVVPRKKMKEKNVRKELEELIENLAINERNIGTYFDEEVELEARKLPEAAKRGPDENVVASARESAGQDGVAFIQKIDETVFNDFLLEVDFSDKFKKRFSGKKIEQDMKRRIVEKIIMLAQGRKNATSCKTLEGLPKEKGISLHECKLTEGARIVWEYTKAFSPVKGANTDTIRVWDVVMDHGNLDREIRNIVKSACIGKSMATVSQGLECGPNTEQNTDDQNVSHLPYETSGVKNEYDLKFYSFTFSVIEALLNGEGKAEINFPFKVTELEHTIINLQPKPPCPIILLGRSGTGKTTCCLYRLCTEFQNYWKKAVMDGPQCRSFFPSEGTSKSCQGASSSVSMIDGPKLEHFHPLFISKNDVLCSEVRRNFNGIIRTNPTMTSVVVSDDSLPNRIQDLEDTSWPLIVGSRDWLLLLDASLPGDPFFQRKSDGSLQDKVKGWGKLSKHMRFLPVDDEDQKEREVQEVSHQHTEETKQQRRRKPTKSKRELTYQVFRDELWSKMEAKLRKKIHPTLVWTEIRSFIKGSAEALKTPQGFLSRDDYRGIGHKRAPYFVGDRDVVYDLFELYQKCLTAKEMFDEADLVYHLHKRLSEDPELQWSIHSVYVDETQDFTQAELSLLIRCCSYGYRNKMFFTGDTAQSIMKGIAFRFDDIKTLLYNLKSHDVTINVPIKSSIFQLTHNYRSHSGILRLASSVVKLLERFFPQSFDKLPEDTALFDGPKPVLLESCSVADLALILQGNNRQTSRIEFGAHQAVLVVSEEARDNMPEELKHGLVLTIYEAKGLEFDDVLIYNFFKDSQAKKEWRVVTSYAIEEQQKQVQSAGLVEIHDKDLTPTSRPLSFNYEEHKVLNSEFKHLYTAITRARRRLWFFDEDAKARGPMFEYFKRLNLVILVCSQGQREDT